MSRLRHLRQHSGGLARQQAAVFANIRPGRHAGRHASDVNASFSERLRFQMMVLGAGTSITGATYCFMKTPAMESSRELHHEQAWFGQRGAFSSDRAIAVVPLTMCIGSGALAFLISLRFPQRVTWVQLPASIHDILALPLAILIAFRFNNSYDRWWSSRREVENIAASLISLAMCATSNVQWLRNGSKSEKDKQAGLENHDRLVTLVEIFCTLAECTLHEFPSKCELEASLSAFSAEDRAICTSASDPLLWCVDSIMVCISTGQFCGQFSAEMASEMYNTLYSIQSSIHNCEMILKQSSPACFVVHLRSFALFYCFTYPFSILGRVQPALLIPAQILISYSLLGIEFCSREMEHPFGNDGSDIPVRNIMEDVRKKLKAVVHYESRRCCE